MQQEFIDEINKAAKVAINGMHVAVPATILKYDPEKNLALVQPKMKYKTPNNQTIDYPKIDGVPVTYFHSGQVTMAYPVKPGDDCLLVFAEGSLDYWLYGKETDTDLKFDLSNAVAIPNLNNIGRAPMVEACKEDAVVIQNGSTKLKVRADGVFIEGNLTQSKGIVRLN